MQGNWVLTAAALVALAGPVHAARSAKATINFISADGIGKPAGTVTITEGKSGVTIVPRLKGLPPGTHGFHLHEKASCDPADKDGTKTAGLAAGGHFDPGATKAHKGPGGGGHKGDLPKLVVSPAGEAKEKVEVEGLALIDFRGKALVIHAGGDNYSDTPEALGGGGARIACGALDKARIASFCRQHHVRKLALFGSVLRDDFSPTSDVDVLVEFEAGHIPGFAFIDLQDELSAILGRSVDLQTPGSLSRYFRDRCARRRSSMSQHDDAARLMATHATQPTGSSRPRPTPAPVPCRR